LISVQKLYIFQINVLDFYYACMGLGKKFAAAGLYMAFNGKDMEFSAQRNYITVGRNGIRASKSIKPLLQKFSRGCKEKNVEN
jgi:hypothetical protein